MTAPPNDEGDEIVVNGTKSEDSTSPPSIILIGGGPGYDTGLPRDPKVLETMLENAKKAKDTKLAKRIIRQQKMLSVRNANKLRGLGKFRSFPFLLVPTVVLEQQMHSFNCQYGINDGKPCGA